MRFADGECLFDTGGSAAAWLRNFQIFEQLAEALAVFGEVDGIGRCADDGHAGGEQTLREIERRLSAELDDHADLCAGLRFVVVDGEHVFKDERLKVEAVAGVVVGRDGLRIAVDHDGLVAIVFERESGVAAAVVELDSLADAVGARAENDDLRLVGRRRFVLFVVGRVEVGRHRFELGGAGVHELEDGANALPFAQFPHLLDAVVAFELPLGGDALVAEAETLQLAQLLRADLVGVGFAAIAICASVISRIWCRNHGSMPVRRATSRTLMPRSKAKRM